MDARVKAQSGIFSTKMMVSTAMLIALTVVMMLTPVGRIQLPIISVTIAHIPILIAALVFGLYPGLAVALAFGLVSLFVALIAPATLLDPFFVNPLISILPRLLIPVTTYFSYRGLSKLLEKMKGGAVVSAGISVAVGNLTNTFGVYCMLYLVYARRIMEETGQSALTLIITAISTSTAIKCVAVVVLTVPLVMALKKAMRYI
ncbi:MAG: ECF transporter S component [Oscillospiraceae bacterium]|jgi:uncharacterized membrane protein|nr:ECF transporter S component [Oscillospiraceae bacterium]